MVRKRNWGQSNKFSEGHRAHLPGNFCLWDIDGLFLGEKNQIEGIYEGKYKMESKDRGNFIETFYSGKNPQANFLQEISKKIPVWISEESTYKWWYLENGNLNTAENPRKDIINTQDRIYVEDILNTYGSHKFSGIFYRTEGEKSSIQGLFSESLSYLLNCPLVLVNDVFKDESIFIKHQNDVIEIHLKESESWVESWRDLSLV
jgi:hypothetical protein